MEIRRVPLSDTAGPAGPAVTIPRSAEHVVRAGDGREYRLRLAWPAEPPPPAGFPIVYVLDANAMFGTMVESLRMRSRRPDATGVEPAVIAGIAYPGDAPDERARRTYDYTPPPSSEPKPPDDGSSAILETGGAPAFREFIDHVVKPAAQRDLRIDPARQTLFGHSLAGRFVLHTLLTSPTSFQTYIAVSPSVWWDREALFASVDTIAQDPARPLGACRVLVTVGEYEQVLAPWQRSGSRTEEIASRRADRRMVDDARAFAARLEHVSGEVRFDELAGEDHASVVLRSINQGLRFASSAP